MESGTGTAERQAGLWSARPRDWAEVQEGQVRPLYDAVHETIGVAEGMRLLDIGCGAGMAAQLAAARGAQVSGFDATEALLEIARERTPQGDFRQGDMESLPFDDDSFDAAVSFNGVQFAADPAQALREAARVVVAGGPIAVATWGQAEDCDTASVFRATGELLPPPPSGAPGPFALAEPGALEEFVGRAGLTPKGGEEVATVWRYPDLETALRGLNASGPGTATIAAVGEERVNSVVEEALAPFRTPDGGVEMTNVFRYLIAASG